ncbi:unnamed protein product [Rotaria socialis]
MASTFLKTTLKFKRNTEPTLKGLARNHSVRMNKLRLTGLFSTVDHIKATNETTTTTTTRAKPFKTDQIIRKTCTT